MPFSKIFSKVAPFFVLLIPLIILIPGWEGFVYSPRSAYSDLAISHYPNAIFLIKTLEHGQLPLWSPFIMGGYPFAADPLAGIWYLPGWIAYLFPLPSGFNINVLLHFFFNGIGMWFFLRAMDIDELPSIIGALAWELLPKIFAHFGAGHLTLVYAIAWTPWLMLAETKSKHKKPDLWVGIILGMIALADVRWVAYAGLMWLLFSMQRFKGNFAAKATLKNIFDEGVIWLRNGMGTILLSVFIAAPLLIPFYEYLQASTRSNLKVGDNLTLAIAPIQLFGIIAPNFQGYAEWIAYSGGAVLIALVWAICVHGLRKKVIFWLALMIAALLLSLGGAFPPNYWISRLPGWDLLRVPSRFMLIFGFSGVVVLANFVNMTLIEWKSQSMFWGNLVSFGLTAFTWVIVAGLWLITGQPAWSYIWSAVFLSICVVFFTLYKRGLLAQQIFLMVIMVGVIIDLGTTSYSEFVYRQNSEVFSDGEQSARMIANSASLFRFYSPSYSISQQTAMNYDLQSIHGIDPLQLKTLTRFLEPASGISMNDYSVTIPPYLGDNPKISNPESQPESQLLGLLNVKYVLSEYAINRPGLSEWRLVDSTHIYLNDNWRTRAWIQPDVEDRNSWKPAGVTEYSANKISASVDGPGILVLSEIYYPGWQVIVDGIPAQLIPVYGLLRGVNLDSGVHQVEFLFRPVSVMIGLAFTCVAWLWVFSTLVSQRRY